MKTYTFNAKKLFPIYPVTVGFNFEQDDINRPLGVDMELIFVVSGGHGSISIDAGICSSCQRVWHIHTAEMQISGPRFSVLTVSCAAVFLSITE